MKTKKILYYLLVISAVICVSCKDELPLPEIDNVEITGGESANGVVKITTGESVTYSLKVDNVEVSAFEWYVDNELKSNDEKFTFTPDKRGKYKVSVKVYNKDGEVSEKAIGEVLVVDQAAIIESITINDKPIEGVIKIPMLPDSVIFRVKATNVEVAEYKWYYNEGELATMTVDTLKMLPNYSGKLKVVLANLDGIETEQDIEFEGVFKEGLFFFGTTNEGISFYDPAKEIFFRGKNGNLYQQVNDEEIGRGGINDVKINNNKIYFLLTSSKEESARVVIADAQTLAKIDIITASEFNTKTLGDIYNLAIVSEEKAYIGYNSASSGNISGVRVLNMKDKTLSEPIEGTSGSLGVDGPAWSRMINVGNDVLIGCGSKLQVIDGKTDKVKKTIEIDKDRQVVDILKGKDNLYMLVDGKVDKSSPFWLWNVNATTSPSIVKLNSTDYSIIQEDELLIEDRPVSMSAGLNNSRATISPVSDIIYFVESGWSAQKVYAYHANSGTVKEFTNISGKSGLFDKFSGYLGVDNQGKLYIPTTNYTTSHVGKFNLSGGFSGETYRVNGDANVISTNQ